MSAKFRKKPVVIEAMRYGGPQSGEFSDVNAVTAFGAKVEPTGAWGREGDKDEWTIQIWNEPEACWVRCPVGHWVIRGVDAEFYPCDPDIFDKTYELVEDGE